MTLTEQELKLANLDNLTRLWQAMGTNSQVLSEHKAFLSRSWPYRFWHEQAAVIQGRQVSQPPGKLNNLPTLPGNTVIPVWPSLNGAHKSLEQALIDADYIHSLELLAMALTVSEGIGNKTGKAEKHNEAGELRLITCASQDEIKRWTQIGSGAFGYEIDVKVVQALAEDSKARVILAYEDRQPVATALLFHSHYKNAGITGIHQLGVAEKYRGRGIARRLMSALLTQSAADTDFFCLQASIMGKGLYLSLGFKELFLINNYRKAP
ncbi:GNAT family N-acetyltransferase [Thalassomonas actiniarum]|uniref:GNAT family N-acetyltransferase n=1 Tax=Thalassomonas actiniarum TaxID=485447 RepID=A0AAF0C5L4_9GAMM|nr:GNAT family N-acetyltransferase [Thalassomonas actiniarum]WDE01124.1 GNAT family N-acetyltransferase [Thalassomonas actiniarum]